MSRATWRHGAVALLGVVAAGLLVLPRGPATVRAQMVPATLQTVAADTPVPPSPSDPATAQATATRPQEEQERPEPSSGEVASPVTQPAVEGATPTRTRRPTRTPRTTATATPTPLVTGSLRLEIASDPAVLVAGRRAVLALTLVNLGEARVADLTLQATVPDGVLVDTVEGRPGLTSRAGTLVRWYLPGLEAGASETLRLSGLVARARPEGVRFCAVLLSAGSPVESCGVFAAMSALAAGERAAGTAGPAGTEATGTTDATDESAGRVLDQATLGLGVLLLGLGLLGVALGLRRPGRGE